MNFYTGKDLARSFRDVRDNTITIAEEMHHRGQLMLVQRMIGLVPHLTRRQQERFAASRP